MLLRRDSFTNSTRFRAPGNWAVAIITQFAVRQEIKAIKRLDDRFLLSDKRVYFNT
jgi:hypothetical protein